MRNQLIRKLHGALMFFCKDQCELHLLLLLFFCAYQESLYKEDDGCGNVLWVKLCPSQKLCWSFNSWYLWMWSFLDTGSLQMLSSSDEVIRVSSSPIKLMSFQEEESVMWWQDKRLEPFNWKPRNAKDYSDW